MNKTRMNPVYAFIIAASLAGATSLAVAENTSAQPHDQHPNSTKQGDYLKDQPSDSNAQQSNDGSMNSDTTQKSTLEKGQSHKQKPASGGVDVKSKN